MRTGGVWTGVCAAHTSEKYKGVSRKGVESAYGDNTNWFHRIKCSILTICRYSDIQTSQRVKILYRDAYYYQLLLCHKFLKSIIIRNCLHHITVYYNDTINLHVSIIAEFQLITMWLQHYGISINSPLIFSTVSLPYPYLYIAYLYRTWPPNAQNSVICANKISNHVVGPLIARSVRRRPRNNVRISLLQNPLKGNI